MRRWPVMAALVVVLLVLGLNLFGRQLNALFLALPGVDKVLHTVGYFLVFLALWPLSTRLTQHPQARGLITIGAGVFLSLCDELVQSQVPGRSVEVYDMAANAAGLTLGWVISVRPAPRVAIAATTAAVMALGYATYDTHIRLVDYSRALQYERNHDFARAYEHYRRAVARGLSGSSVHNGFAWVAVESGLGDPEETLVHARRALEMEPHNPDVLDTYGWALHYAGRSDEALRPLLQALRLKPDMFCIHYHLGAVYLALSRPADAEAHLRRQVELAGTREAALAAQALASMER